MNRIIFENVRDIDLDHIFQCGQCFRWIPEDNNDSSSTGRYRGVAGSYFCQAELEKNDGFAGTLTLNVTGGDEKFWRDYFDLDRDYGQIKEKLVEQEPRISVATREGGGIRILNQDFWEVLISFIVSQNNNIPRIMKCIEGLCSAFGEPVYRDMDGKTWYSFPKPEALLGKTEEDLKEIKLGYRDSYIVRAADKFLKNGIPAGTMEEKRKQLLEYHGIGPKVADCIMLFGCREFTAFPVDTWVKTIMNDMYGFEKKDIKGMQAFARERFGDLRGFAQQYLFYLYRDKGIK
ncbi:MAG: DNA glycosylase [Baileyella intestinalis]|uniref:DNA-3-methyladenine glycosylase family protein n=1 Tax=Baileyella intestinalis TaxID=2606709 RepID=UPI002A75C108|nr:DNA glycosylase [Baileyella intestinalis]MCI7685907.1 8-oxoguanine DNA glycosylase [Clostridiales bacterium]MDY2995185.1 DNA glycosylase [Baileyella intestinalis]